MRVLRRGYDNRHTGETRLNCESSRSHCVFTCVIERTTRQRGSDGGGGAGAGGAGKAGAKGDKVGAPRDGPHGAGVPRSTPAPPRLPPRPRSQRRLLRGCTLAPRVTFPPIPPNLFQVEGELTKVMFSRLNLIDLAGSERIRSGAHGGSGAQGEHFKEACHINKSLTTLGRCAARSRCRSCGALLRAARIPRARSELLVARMPGKHP